MSSTYGTKVKISIFGQSHSEAIGVTLDGLPARFRNRYGRIADVYGPAGAGERQVFHAEERSRPARIFEPGLVGDVTCGAPLTAIIRNTNTRRSRLR